MENYLRDGLAPLKRYLSMSKGSTDEHAENEGYHSDDDNDGGILDWGIDSNQLNDISSPTLINDFANSTFEVDHSINGMTPYVEDKFYDWGISPKKNQNTKFGVNNALNELQLKCEEQKLKNMAFFDEFRYILVSSQLLDETIMVSKFAQRIKKKSILDLRKSSKEFGQLITISAKYHISSLINDFNIIKNWSLIRHMGKSLHKYSSKQIKLVCIISIIHLNFIMRANITRLKIIQSKLLNQLKHFIKTFQNFDILIQKLITKYKELKIYNNIIPNHQINTTSENPDHIYETITSSLVLSTNSLMNAINTLLPFTNGIELENYCGIYNIEITELGFQIEELKPFKVDTDPIDLLASKFKKFQFLTRFFIVILLAMNHQRFMHSPFLNKVFGIFQINNGNDCSLINKLLLISRNLENLQQTGLNMNKIIERSTTLNSNNVSTTIRPIDKSTDPLLNKVKELELQIILLRRNKDPQLLKELGITLEDLTTIHKKEVLNSNPKSLLTVGKRNNRLSLPPTSNYSYPIQQRSKSTSHKNYKRLSTGFALPLLTVTEEDETPSKRAVSYDDNYLNIMPSHDFSNEDSTRQIDYIQENNLLSNDDSVVITSNDLFNESDDDSTVLDSEAFKQKLELNFTKMINGSGAKMDKFDDKTITDDEINLNNQKVDMESSESLMNELKAVMNK